MLLNALGNPYSDDLVAIVGKYRSRGKNLLYLDTIACFTAFLTSWSGLFFILYPHCESNTTWCVVLVIVIAGINGMFCAYCLGVFLKAKYNEARFQVFDKARAYKSLSLCLQSCLQVEDKPGFREVWQREKQKKSKELFLLQAL